jgi:hypothetical protein
VSIVEALLLSPSVGFHLTHDETIRRFDIENAEIEPTSFNALLRIVRGEPVTIVESSAKSLLLLSQSLGNNDLEQCFFGLQFDTSGTAVLINPGNWNHFNSTAFSIDLTSKSIENIKVLSITALKQILSSDSLQIESEDWLLNVILELGNDYSSLLDLIRWEFVTDAAIINFFEDFPYCDLTERIWDGIIRRVKKFDDSELKMKRFPRLRIDSAIISLIPSIFSVLQFKSFRLLYRGTRDGFTPTGIHGKIDGHSNTVALAETTKGFIYGGYTPLKWDSSGEYKRDDSGKSFIFTLKNPHNLPSQRFALKPDRKDHAIGCRVSDRLLYYGYNGCISIYPGCNSNASSNNGGWNEQNATYENPTGIEGTKLFTGDTNYTLKELEVFELVD